MKISQQEIWSSVIFLLALCSTNVFAENLISDNEVIQLMEVHSTGSVLKSSIAIKDGRRVVQYENCLNDAFNKNLSAVKNYLNQGNSSMASVQATMAAGELSACAIQKIKEPDNALNQNIPNKPLQTWAQEIGELLTMSVIAGSTRVTAEHALTFLTYAKQHGLNVDERINKIKESLGTNDLAKDKPAFTGTAVALVSKFVSNPVSFDQEYKGKSAQVSGKVTNINGDGTSITLRILGNTKKSKDELGFQDSIMCQITHPDAMERVKNVQVGKSVTVRGLYKKHVLGGIELRNCEIL